MVVPQISFTGNAAKTSFFLAQAGIDKLPAYRADLIKAAREALRETYPQEDFSDTRFTVWFDQKTEEAVVKCDFGSASQAFQFYHKKDTGEFLKVDDRRLDVRNYMEALEQKAYSKRVLAGYAISKKSTSSTNRASQQKSLEEANKTISKLASRMKRLTP